MKRRTWIGTVLAAVFGGLSMREETVDIPGRGGSGDSEWTKDQEGNLVPKDGEPVSVDRLLAKQRLDAVFDAHRIRSVAGVPPGITTGVSDSGALASETSLTIASESDAQNASSSGSGTKDDPYVIRGREQNNSEAANVGIDFDDASAGYHVKVVNCDISGYGINIDMNAPTSLTLENVRVGASDGNRCIRVTSGDLSMEKCVVENATGDDGLFFNSAEGELSVRHSEFINNDGYGCNFYNGTTVSVEACYVEADTEGRLVNVSDATDPEVRRVHGKMTAVEDGSGTSSETVVFSDCEGGRIEECWSEQNLADDSFELIRCSGTEVSHVVGDDSYRSVVDNFAGNTNGDFGNYVHHVYGETPENTRAVTFNGTPGSIGHDLFVSAPNGDGVGVYADDCTLIEPLPLAENVGGERIIDDGANTETLGFENGSVVDVNGNIPDSYETIR